MPYRMLVVCINPVQYMAHILRRLAKHPKIDFQVAYCTMRGAEPAFDPEFRATIHWDIPLLDGYKWVEVQNSRKPRQGFWEFSNWGLWHLIRKGDFDAIILYTGYRCASFWIAVAAARSKGTAILFGTDASNLAPRDAQAWKVSLKKLVWPWLFRFADQVVAPSTPT